MAVQESALSTEPVTLASDLCRAAALLYRLAEYCRPLNSDGLHTGQRIHDQCRRLLAAAENVGQRWLRVAVVGDFDAGRSTLISALAGQELLPVHPNPATAVVTWVTHDTRESYYLCPAGDGRPRTLTGDAFRDLQHGRMRQGNAAGVDHLEVRLPFPLLARGVVLLDTPGFDNGSEDTGRAQAVVADCGALILCTPAIHPLSERDLSLLKALCAPSVGQALFDPGQVFLVLTFADASQFQDDPTLMASLMQGLRTRLVSQAELAETAADDLMANRCVAVSGKQALLARTARNREREDSSGITLLEAQLGRFFRRLQEDRLQRGWSALESAAPFGLAVCRTLREQLQMAEVRQRGGADELRLAAKQARLRLALVEGYLTDARREMEERLTQAPCTSIAEPLEHLKTRLINLVVPSASPVPMANPPDWSRLVAEAVAWLADSLQARLAASVSDSRSTSAKQLVTETLLDLHETLLPRLQDPIHEQIGRYEAELQRAPGAMEAERAWTENALHELESLEAELAHLQG